MKARLCFVPTAVLMLALLANHQQQRSLTQTNRFGSLCHFRQAARRMRPGEFSPTN